MPVTKEKFDEWMETFGDRYFPLKEAALSAYEVKLRPAFQHDQQFEAVCIEIFSQDHKRFPAIAEFLEVKQELARRAQVSSVATRPKLMAATEQYAPPPRWLGESMWLQRKLKRQGVTMRFLGDDTWEIQAEEPAQISWNGAGWECSPESFAPRLQKLLAERHAERDRLRQQRDQLTSMADQLTASGL